MEKIIKPKRKILASSDVSIFSSQIALILKSGIPLHDGILAIAESIPDSNGQIIINEVAEQIDNNCALSYSLNKTDAFPNYMVNMVRIGERAGKLEEVMQSLAKYYDFEDALHKRIRSAVTHPFILMIMMCAVITVLVVQVLPIFKEVYNSMGAEMSATATVMMNWAMNFGGYAFLIILILAAVIAVVILVSRTQKGKALFGKFLSDFFVTRKLYETISMARFSTIMSMMFSSGYNLDEALELVTTVVNNKAIAARVRLCRELVTKGESFNDAIIKSRIFTGVYARMVSIGLKTGSIDEVMSNLSDIYSSQADEAIERAVLLIEPILVGVLCVIIGIILLTVMLPLISMMSAIG